MIVFHPFMTREGAEKRARFENAHSSGKWRYSVIKAAKKIYRIDRQPLARK